MERRCGGCEKLHVRVATCCDTEPTLEQAPNCAARRRLARRAHLSSHPHHHLQHAWDGDVENLSAVRCAPRSSARLLGTDEFLSFPVEI